MAADASAAFPTTVIFDVGKVLVDWDPRAFYARHIADPARLDRFFGQIATEEWHVQHDAGRDFADTSAELIARYPDEAENIRRWGDRFVETLGDLVPGMADLVADLDRAGVPLYAITNFSHQFWPAFAAREPVLLAPFRDILVSGEVKLLKPDPAIFALAMRRFGLVRGDALFVDDRPENVAAAEKAGFAGHVFVDATTLRHALEGYRLL